MKPKIIHTKTFSCADDHPIVWYTFDETNKALCGYCAAQFVYEPRDTFEQIVQKDFYTKMVEERELLDMGLKDSIRQKEERTTSEEMQDKLEPIENYVNKILKGSG